MIQHRYNNDDVALYTSDFGKVVVKIFENEVLYKIELYVYSKICGLNYKFVPELLGVLSNVPHYSNLCYGIILEYIPYSVRDIDTENLVAVWKEYAKILLTLRQLGILYIDIKPENMLVRKISPSGAEYCLCDFNSAVITDRTDLSPAYGYGITERYRAPEISGLGVKFNISSEQQVYALAQVMRTLDCKSPLIDKYSEQDPAKRTEMHLDLDNLLREG